MIFDVDGTLIDTVDMHARAWQEAFEYFGRELPFELVRSQIGKGGDQLMPVFLNESELETFGKELEEYRKEHWKRNYLPKVEAFPCVRDLFLRIRQEGKKILLASSAKGEELQTYKKIANIADLIDGETTASDVERSKPAPDIFVAAMDKLDITSTEEVIVVGDAPYDVIAANEIGLETIGLRCGGFPDQVLLDAGAIELYNDPEDLLRNYERSQIARSE